MPLKKRILNYAIGLACFYILLWQGYSVFKDIACRDSFSFHSHIMAPLSLLGWIFIVCAFFSIDAVEAIKKGWIEGRKERKLRKKKRQI